MDIGRHVWVGAGATILKNAVVADECIIGWGSVVSGRFGDSHSVLAGNPARKVRGGVYWEANGSKGYVQNEN